jgi:hypothetical protein
MNNKYSDSMFLVKQEQQQPTSSSANTIDATSSPYVHGTDYTMNPHHFWSLPPPPPPPAYTTS